MTNSDRKKIPVLLAGLVVNLLLAGAKIAVGAIFGLVSVIADGFNNFGDCGSGMISWISLVVASKPADQDHPYGHRRAESIAVLLTGVLILLLAAGLLRESVSKILGGEKTEAPLIIAVFLIVSIAVKAAMGTIYRAFGVRHDSEVLRAAATDSFCDCLCTAAVLAGTSFPGLDGWAGIVVAVFVGVQGIKLLLEACSKLLGRAPDPKLKDAVKTAIEESEGVLGFHDLRIYTYGRGAAFATVHVEMDASLPALASHAVLDELERRVSQKTGVLLTTHLDPVDLNDGEAHELEQKIISLAEGLCEGIKLHDFRVIRGTCKKIIFEVSVPYACKRNDAEIVKKLAALVKEVTDGTPLIQVERE